MRSSMLLLAILALGSSLSAQQNLLLNGGFEASATSIAPWKIYRPVDVRSQRILSGVPVGLANDRAFFATYHRKANSFIDLPGLEQNFTIPASQNKKEFLFSAAVADRFMGATITADVYQGLKLIRSRSKMVDAWHGPAMMPLGHLYAGNYKLILRVTTYLPGKEVGLDDLTLRAVDQPYVWIDWMKTPPSPTLLFRVENDVANSVEILFVSTDLLPKGIQVPGVVGKLMLDPARGSGVIALGAGAKAYPLPQKTVALLGISLHFQAYGTIGASAPPRLGSVTSWRAR